MLNLTQESYRPVLKRHRLVYKGGFPKFETLYCSLNMVSSTEIL